MPYEGEFAGYRPLQRITESEKVQQLLKNSRVFVPSSVVQKVSPTSRPDLDAALPEFAVAIDGSNAEVPVKNGYPGAHVGYCTVASVLLNLAEVERLDENRPVDPKEFRKTEEASTIDAALPGSNVVTRSNRSAQVSFRESVYETFQHLVIADDSGNSLLSTYEALLSLKPKSHLGEMCPYSSLEDCSNHLNVGVGVGTCACAKKLPIYSTDALRIHERFRDVGSNGEAFGEVRSVWERVLLVHLLRWFERKKLLSRLDRMAFILDGPLAVFGHPAWLSQAIKTELKRINSQIRKETGRDLLLLGIEKSGTFVEHFNELDKTESGEPYFPNASYALLTDEYIKQRIIFSDSTKPYGADTYFGRKFFYKTKGGSKIVATLPFLTDEQEDLKSDKPDKFPSFPTVCHLLDRVASSRFPNSLSPIISAHAQAAIPLHLGTKVLEQLAKALMKKD